jgi:hypothetical protein
MGTVNALADHGARIPAGENPTPPGQKLVVIGLKTLTLEYMILVDGLSGTSLLVIYSGYHQL